MDAAADLRARLARSAYQHEVPPPPAPRAWVPPSKSKLKRLARKAKMLDYGPPQRYVWVMVDGRNELQGPFTVAEVS